MIRLKAVSNEIKMRSVKRAMSNYKNSEHATDLLAGELENLPRELPPGRDLWQGIERRLADHPHRKWREPRIWMPIALVASLQLAATSLLFNFLDSGAPGPVMPTALEQMQFEYQLVHGPMSREFNWMNRRLPDESLSDLNWNLQLLEQARWSLEAAIRQDPDNRRLLTMLMKLHEQELDLLKEVFYEPDVHGQGDVNVDDTSVEGTDVESTDVEKTEIERKGASHEI